MKICPADPGYLGDIHKLWLEGNRLFAGAPALFQGGDFEDIERAIESGDVLISRSGGECVGFIAFWVGGGTATLTHLIVDKALRGKGIGTSLVKAAERVAKERGATRVVGLTWPKNGIHEMYHKAGYSTIGYVVGIDL